MRGKAHAPEVRAAVMSALLAGQSTAEVAAQYHLSPALVRRWRQQIPTERLNEVAREKREKNEDDFGVLLAEYVRETLTTLAVQAKHFRDPGWLQKQSASELAVLHGVQTDKAIRLLAAYERAEQQPEQQSGPNTTE